MATFVLAAGSAHAGPHLEASGFFGAAGFGDRTALGDSTFAEQRPETAALLGVRLTAWMLAFRSFELGIEPELSFAPAWTGYGFDGPRPSYFAPVLGYSGSLIVRIRQPRFFQPHLLVGAGGASVFSRSPYVTNDTDPVLFFGVGATAPLGQGWHLRLDARLAAMQGRDQTTAAIYEGMVGVGYRFGAHHARGHHGQVNARIDARTDDQTEDQIVDRPTNGAVEPPAPGTPVRPADRDGDGIPDASDKCPDQAEDFDHFEDEDGCPDPDNDHDGVPDALDKCPNAAETPNGFEDEDGCPDSLPPEVGAAFAAASAVRFEPTRARLTETAKAALGNALAQLRAHPTMHVVVIGHPDASNGEPLARKRAEVVRWYLVEQGVPADQLELDVGPVAKLPIELAAAPPRAH
jgi:outer membrane protein OmpA-like peptidoglycan-associated protein